MPAQFYGVSTAQDLSAAQASWRPLQTSPKQTMYAYDVCIVLGFLRVQDRPHAGTFGARKVYSETCKKLLCGDYGWQAIINLLVGVFDLKFSGFGLFRAIGHTLLIMQLDLLPRSEV